MNLKRPLSRVHVERIIGSARVALAASSLFALWHDPTEPSRHVGLTYTLHSIYVAYSLILAVVMWRRDSAGRLPLATHATDIGVASVFQYLTLGPSNPFFVYFVFALFSAALRWGWRGTVRTAAVGLAAFIVVGMSLSWTLGPTEFERSHFTIRTAYLLMAAALLGYLGLHEERLRDEVRRLARWPLTIGRDMDSAVRQLLEHSAGIVSARRALLMWTKDDEPWMYMASWPGPASSTEKYPPGELEPAVPAALADAAFVCRGPLSGASHLTISRNGAAGTWTGLPIHPGLQPRLAGTGLASSPFVTDRISGRVFFADLGNLSADMMPIIEVVGREIGASLDQLYSHERSREIAVADDRIRLARDLHDGVLQSLTGLRLELQELAGAQGIDGRQPAVGERLLGIERALAVEQRELRHFIEDLKPSQAAAAGASLRERLEELRRRLELQWRAQIAIRVHPDNLTLPRSVDRALVLMVHEAVINALRHGDPSTVSVAVASKDDRVVITVEDDGRGFAFKGRRDHASLVASNAGPISLRERVTSLGGRIAIDSSPRGACVELSLPLQAARA